MFMQACLDMVAHQVLMIVTAFTQARNIGGVLRPLILWLEIIGEREISFHRNIVAVSMS